MSVKRLGMARTTMVWCDHICRFGVNRTTQNKDLKMSEEPVQTGSHCKRDRDTPPRFYTERFHVLPLQTFPHSQPAPSWPIPCIVCRSGHNQVMVCSTGNELRGQIGEFIHELNQCIVVYQACSHPTRICSQM